MRRTCYGPWLPANIAIFSLPARAVGHKSRRHETGPAAALAAVRFGRRTETAEARIEVESDRLGAAPEGQPSSPGKSGGLPAKKSRRGWLVRRALLAADVTGLTLAFVASEVLFRGSAVEGGVSTPVKAVVFVLALPVWVVGAKLYGMYDRDEERATHSTADEVMSVFHLVTVGVLLFYASSWLVGLTRPDQVKLSTFWLLALLAVITSRMIARTIVRRHPAYLQNTVVVGAGDVGQLIARKLRQHPEYRINLVGFVDANPKELRADVKGVPLLGESDEIVDIVRRHGVDRVIIAFSQDLHQEMLQLVFALRRYDVQIDVVPRLFEIVSPNAALHAIEGLPLVGLAPTRIPRSSRLLKRALDI